MVQSSGNTDRRSGGGQPRPIRVERRVIQGREARVRRDPSEIHVEWRPGRAVYLGVRVGDHIKNADRDVESARIDEWEVTEITPSRVVGRNVKTGADREWSRETLERGLVVGNYATNLSDFALVTAYRVGNWADYDPEPDANEAGVYHGRPYITVIAYGNNGQKYGRRYRFRDDDTTTVELWDQDPDTERLTAAQTALLDARVRQALEDDGYVVVAD